LAVWGRALLFPFSPTDGGVERIGKRIAKVSPEEIDQVIEGLNEIIG
jgi:hypothetical protein